MFIKKIQIKNFRLLREVELFLEQRTTVIVGRNNSGKTSLTELFRRLLTESTPVFKLEDFSLSAHEDFWKAFLLKLQVRQETEIRQALPVIEIKLTISYEKEALSLGALSDFIIDLNSDCTEALIVISYRLKDGEIDAFFEDLNYDPAGDQNLQRIAFFREIKERIRKSYEATILAEDPQDATNQKSMEWTQLRTLVQSGFINAQRGLDDTTHKDINLLGKILEALLNSAMADSADAADRDVAEKLEKAVENMQQGIDDGFNEQLLELLPAFSLFGYPGLKDPRLRTETILDIQRLLKDHTKVHYAGLNGINLPEAYNGLGVRNLIYILLKLLEFFKAFRAVPTASDIHLIFIEEPEVHLHPQMQEVFIGKLNDIAQLFAVKFNEGQPWPVQFVVTTHSSHLANRAPFASMRYFLANPIESGSAIFKTQIKDLRNGLGGALEEDQEFLHKYMTLTRCDLLFADKAVLIEGPTERLLLPKMISKIDEGRADSEKLENQYISIVEVGGAYAHRFFQLLEFLELRTLIITDLDAAKKNEQNRFVSCKASESTHTTNGCIKDWFGDSNIRPDRLIEKNEEEKTKGIKRLAYEVPETNEAPCGRSFEEAFILANLGLFELRGLTREQNESKAAEIAEQICAKTDFALKYAIQKTEWIVPKYIADGLRWLSKDASAPAPAATPAAQAVQTEVASATSTE